MIFTYGVKTYIYKYLSKVWKKQIRYILNVLNILVECRYTLGIQIWLLKYESTYSYMINFQLKFIDPDKNKYISKTSKQLW